MEIDSEAQLLSSIEHIALDIIRSVVEGSVPDLRWISLSRF